jgi:hypothetical protein
MSVDRVNGLATGIMQSFKFGQIPPLEALAALLVAYESMFKNLMGKSAPGMWKDNHEGLMVPLQKMKNRLDLLQEPSPIVLPGEPQ